MPPITGISIHAPRVGSDFFSSRYNSSNSSYFNPRSPCGERQKLSDCFLWAIRISIHAPRVGSDGRLFPRQSPYKDFNPRSPCGERPAGGGAAAHKESISIHAPRVGSDVNWDNGQRIANRNFNPRSPCGERQAILTSLRAMVIFQSTLPVWGATIFRLFLTIMWLHFNPRSPCGERPRTRIIWWAQ